MKRFLTWFWLLNKRLLKKPSFLAVLLLVPLLVAAFAVASKGENGMLTVAVASEGESELYDEIVARLKSGAGLITVGEYDAAAAREKVKNGSVDAAWIFADKLEEHFIDYVEGRSGEGALVTVLQREESVLLQMSREKLLAAMYPQLSFSLYSQFVTMRYPSLDVKNESLRGFYDMVEAEGDDLFRIVYPDGMQIDSESGYLLSPVRGLLAVLTVIGGLAVSLYYVRDEREGRFSLVAENKRFVISLIFCFVAVLDIAVFSLIALLFAGLSVFIGREILLLFLLVLSTVAFCTLIRLLCVNEAVLGSFIPIIAVFLIAVSPIFVNINVPVWLKMLLPTTGYLAGLYSNADVMLWIAYIACTYVLCLVVSKVRSTVIYQNE